MIIQKSKNKKYFFILLGCILFVLTILSISYGPVSISIKQIFEILLHRFGLIDEYSFNQIQETVLINIRFPRIFLAILVGIGLATSGAILQGLFRNPLIDPGFIGVSSGAAVGAMIAIMFSNFFSFFITSFLYSFILPILAILGSFLTTIIVYRMSKIFNKTNILAMLLSGIAVNALAGVVGLVAAYVLIQRAGDATGTTAEKIYVPDEKKKSSQLSAMNQFPITVEEEVISKMLPTTNVIDITAPEFKPVLDDNHEAESCN